MPVHTIQGDRSGYDMSSPTAHASDCTSGSYANHVPHPEPGKLLYSYDGVSWVLIDISQLMACFTPVITADSLTVGETSKVNLRSYISILSAMTVGESKSVIVVLCPKITSGITVGESESITVPNCHNASVDDISVGESLTINTV